MSKKKRKKIIKRNVSTIRVFFVVVGIFLFVGVIFFRLYWLQIKKHQYFSNIANEQYRNKKELKPRRGEIMFKEKDYLVPAAVNKNMPTVFVVPSEIDDKNKTAQQLADILDLDLEKVKHKLTKKMILMK